MTTNTILTPTAVTREALRVLHQKLNFVTNINTEYDDSYAKTGAKIGDSLKIRQPNEYVVSDGATMVLQDTDESSVTLQISKRKHVAMQFTTQELTLSLDDFSKRIIQPAMARLAAKVEADAMSMFLDVYNAVDNVGAAVNFNKLMLARKKLVDNLTPEDDNMFICLNTQDNVDLIDALKGLFHDSKSVGDQYKKGIMGRTAGFEFYENTLIPNQTTGTSPSATTYKVNGAVTTNGSTTVTLKTGTATFKKGDVFTISGCTRVHPETKDDTGVLQQFVVTADYSGGAGDLSFSPAIYTSGGKQNVVAAGMANNADMTKLGGASSIYKPSIAFHKDAFTFATADLEMPGGVDFAARENFDGLSLRIVRQYNITDDVIPCRIDILYGYKTLRPQMACRILSN